MPPEEARPPVFVPSPPAKIRFSAIGDGFRLLGERFGLWAVSGLLFFVLLNGVSYAIGLILERVGWQPTGEILLGQVLDMRWDAVLRGLAPSLIVNTVLTAFLQADLMRLAVRQVRGEPVHLADLLLPGRMAAQLLIVSLVSAALTTVGYALCILPGLVVAGLLMLAPPLIVDKDLDAFAALRQSIVALRGQWFMAAGFVLLVFLAALVGVLGCGIGLIFTAPIIPLAVAVVYRDFFGDTDATASRSTDTNLTNGETRTTMVHLEKD